MRKIIRWIIFLIFLILLILSFFDTNFPVVIEMLDKRISTSLFFLSAITICAVSALSFMISSWQYLLSIPTMLNRYRTEKESKMRFSKLAEAFIACDSHNDKAAIKAFNYLRSISLEPHIKDWIDYHAQIAYRHQNHIEWRNLKKHATLAKIADLAIIRTALHNKSWNEVIDSIEQSKYDDAWMMEVKVVAYFYTNNWFSLKSFAENTTFSSFNKKILLDICHYKFAESLLTAEEISEDTALRALWHIQNIRIIINHALPLKLSALIVVGNHDLALQLIADKWYTDENILLKPALVLLTTVESSKAQSITSKIIRTSNSPASTILYWYSLIISGDIQKAQTIFNQSRFYINLHYQRVFELYNGLNNIDKSAIEALRDFLIAKLDAHPLTYYWDFDKMELVEHQQYKSMQIINIACLAI